MKEIEKELEIIYAIQRAEEREMENIIAEVYPITSKLTNEEISNPKLLKEKLKAIKNKKYRDLTYALFRLSRIKAPEGSFLTLNPNKISILLNKY